MLKRSPLTICGSKPNFECLKILQTGASNQTGIIVDFWPAGTSTFRRECGLSKSKYVANILSLSSGVILFVMISFVRWCRVHSVLSEG